MKQVAGRNTLGGFADEFAAYNDDVLFGEVWSNDNSLTLKERCIITISALVGKGITDDSLKYHLLNAKKNGVCRNEMADILTHVAFYAGWPNAWAALKMAKDVYGDDDASNHGGIFGMGEENLAYQKYFTGKSYLKMLTSKDNGIVVANVTFEPGSRNHWHIHAAKEGGGQLLLAVEGKGIYQEKGKEPIIMRPGSVVYIPSNVEHFHGAFPASWFSHLAIEIPGKDSETIWLKEVNEEEYLKATTSIKE